MDAWDDYVSRKPKKTEKKWDGYVPLKAVPAPIVAKPDPPPLAKNQPSAAAIKPLRRTATVDSGSEGKCKHD